MIKDKVVLTLDGQRRIEQVTINDRVVNNVKAIEIYATVEGTQVILLMNDVEFTRFTKDERRTGDATNGATVSHNPLRNWLSRVLNHKVRHA